MLVAVLLVYLLLMYLHQRRPCSTQSLYYAAHAAERPAFFY
jgi:hypothetical protein